MLHWIDLVILLVALIAVAGVSIYASRGERTREDYFLAGRKLTWWLVGISLIASNISTEHFVGMSGSAAKNGLAVASWEWTAAVALVIVGLWLLPIFLRAGVYTIPEFLEYRFDRSCRSIMAGLMVILFVITVLSVVLYSGSTFLSGVLDLPGFLERRFGMSPERSGGVAFQIGVWGIGFFAGVYTVLGGLKAVVWSDLLQGLGLIIGGAVVAVLATIKLGDGGGFLAGVENFVEANSSQMHLARPLNDPDLPWLTLFTGIWIPTIFYWGLNQFITQRALAAGSLSEGQKGVMLAAAIKLIIPLIVVIPGIMAFQILGDQFPADSTDSAYPMLLRELLPIGLLGLMLAAVTGAVLSTFNSGLNSAATVFTLDLWTVHVKKNLTEMQAVQSGRWVTVILAVAACLWAPVIKSFDGVFNYIQELWGFVSAPTVAVFIVGLTMRRVPAVACRTALIAGPLIYLLSRAPNWMGVGEGVENPSGVVGAIHWYTSLAPLYHMFTVFVILVVGMGVWGKVKPLNEAVGLPNRPVIDMTPWKGVKPVGVAICLVTLGIYVWLW